MTREKAIKIVKEFINGTCLHLVDQEALETLIPELAESEDERIKKDIINLIYWLKANPSLCSQYYKDRYDGMLSWLEKQKEQKSSIFPPGLGEVHWNPIPSAKKELMEKPAEPSGKPSRQEYLYHLLANGVITFSDYEFLMRNKGRKPADLSEMMVHKEPYIAPVPTPMVADEQKPIDYDAELEKCKHNFLYFWDKYVTVKRKTVKWSKEDEEMLQSIIKDFRDGNISSIGQEQWLKSLPERLNLQPKQEWSEEDEKDMAHIIRILDDCYVYGTHDLSKTDHENLVNKLKSLRPSWKPSEEQN